MRIPPFWTRATARVPGRPGNEQAAWGWSFDSMNAAKADALARAQRIIDRLRDGGHPDQYQYLHQPLHETIVRTIKSGDKDLAVITRNCYGALILNCASVCFVDVDFPPARSAGPLDSILSLFSSARRQQRAQGPIDATVQKVRQWAEANPDRSFRIYRTFAGLRLLFTDGLYSPTSSQTAALLDALGSDPLYRRLTEKQECFRARLTPKPWRCGHHNPPSHFLPEDTRLQQVYQRWVSDYETRCRDYAVCQLLDTAGRDHAPEPISTIVRLHDQYTCNSATTALA
jgi:hypothetical protein